MDNDGLLLMVLSAFSIDIDKFVALSCTDYYCDVIRNQVYFSTLNIDHSCHYLV